LLFASHSNALPLSQQVEVLKNLAPMLSRWQVYYHPVCEEIPFPFTRFARPSGPGNTTPVYD